MTTGGRSMPSMRGIEKPQTSASTTAVFLPRLARLTARLVVTDDLPTPPLPEATSSTRVFEDGSANGMARPSAWPWAAWLPAVAPGSPTICWRTAARSSSVITSKVTRTESTSSRAWTASPTRRSISFFSGQPGTVRATSTWTDAAVDPHEADHAQVDDAAVQFGVLDRSEDVDDLGLGGHRGNLSGDDGVQRRGGDFPYRA